MRKVILKFETPKELWEFRVRTKAESAEINLKNCTLICDCGDAEIELAINAFNAVLFPISTDAKQGSHL